MATKKVKHRSPFEAKVREDLDKRGIKYEYETVQLQYPAQRCPHCKEVIRAATYTPDFIFRDGTRCYLVVEGKGRFTPQDRKKMRAVKEAHPEINLRILLHSNTRIGKSPNGRVRVAEKDRKPDNRKTYGDWCDRNGFIWAVGETIPQSWIDDKEGVMSNLLARKTTVPVPRKRNKAKVVPPVRRTK